MTARGRYPRRNIPQKSYEEDPDIPDDEFIYCDICMQEFTNGCSNHPLKIIRDEQVPLQELPTSRARSTIPKDWLEIRQSGIENAGEGVWSRKFIPAGVRFGPFQGKISKCFRDTSYAWQFKRNGKLFYLDGKNEKLSNWMRFVNCSRNNFERNLVAYQYCGSIYYRTVKHIPPNTELLVYYGSQYAKILGIDTKNFYSSHSCKFFQCPNCFTDFKTEENLKLHQTRCTYHDWNNSGGTDNFDETSLKSSSPESIFRCEFCRLGFGTSYSYENHVKEQHVDFSTKKKRMERVFKKNKKNRCNYCFKYFAAPYFLKRHIAIHTGNREYKCLNCDCKFSRRYHFTQHKLKHDLNKFYMCLVCDVSFFKHCDFQQHIRSHIKDKTYKCDICRKSFKRPDVRNKHRYIHKEYLQRYEENTK